MPIQAPQWTDFLSCPICRHSFDGILRFPISLACGHTLCRQCLTKLHRKQCPFDQTLLSVEAEFLPANTALLRLIGVTLSQSETDSEDSRSGVFELLSLDEVSSYTQCRRVIEKLAGFLRPLSGVNVSAPTLSRPMQRKLVTLVTCQIAELEGKSRAYRAVRSLGDRTVTELLLQHQNPQQLSTNLWAAVRARGCQFLGPAMQEEVLKLVLLALDEGSSLSRKTLVLFVVQRLEPHFPHASKTSIGHVVQLLYRASCFKVSKREGDSSLMQLKDEFRTYDALRREHDAQIVQIAIEAGLRIAPDQWSSLLYGDSCHKSHMQSIIDKLQTPAAFSQAVQELVIALQRTGDPGDLACLRPALELLASIDPSPDASAPTYSELKETLEAVHTVVKGLVDFIAAHGARSGGHHQKILEHHPTGNGHTGAGGKYKTLLCRDFLTKGSCPRASACTFAHSEDELDKYRGRKDSFGKRAHFYESHDSDERNATPPPNGSVFPSPVPKTFSASDVGNYCMPAYGNPSLPYNLSTECLNIPKTAMYAATAPVSDQRFQETSKAHFAIDPANTRPIAPTLPNIEAYPRDLFVKWASTGKVNGLSPRRKAEDDTVVPFGEPLISRYGPISRIPQTPMTSSRSMSQLMTWHGVDNTKYPPIPGYFCRPEPSVFVRPHQQQTPLHHVSSDPYFEPVQVRQKLDNIKRQLDDLKAVAATGQGIQDPTVNVEREQLNQDLIQLETWLNSATSLRKRRTDDSAASRTSIARSWSFGTMTDFEMRNLTSSDDDDEDRGIASGMRELELRLQHELEEEPEFLRDNE
ncbi:roquin-1-like isoform X2 [Artemia franciscana]|uniref:RING-type E3 ubiquitin transferase n=1 Tax=Artemia franciscana TaxID=6661 RepID=A0AA88L1B3_ARTSF|nr:hypothetical protein QYM36_017695 [Artemia franciscana]